MPQILYIKTWYLYEFCQLFLSDFLSLKCLNTPKSKNIPGGKICYSGPNFLIPPNCLLLIHGICRLSSGVKKIPLVFYFSLGNYPVKTWYLFILIKWIEKYSEGSIFGNSTNFCSVIGQKKTFQSSFLKRKMNLHWNRSPLQPLKIQISPLFRGVPWHSDNYRVWIHSKTRTWHDKNTQPNALYR